MKRILTVFIAMLAVAFLCFGGLAGCEYREEREMLNGLNGKYELHDGVIMVKVFGLNCEICGEAFAIGVDYYFDQTPIRQEIYGASCAGAEVGHGHVLADQKELKLTELLCNAEKIALALGKEAVVKSGKMTFTASKTVFKFDLSTVEEGRATLFFAAGSPQRNPQALSVSSFNLVAERRNNTISLEIIIGEKPEAQFRAVVTLTRCP